MSGVGSKPGERRGGRQRGTPNRVNAALRELAGEYTEEALDVLVGVMNDDSAPAAARISAANAILDRGCGKPRPAPEPRPATLDVTKLTLEELHDLVRIYRAGAVLDKAA